MMNQAKSGGLQNIIDSNLITVLFFLRLQPYLRVMDLSFITSTFTSTFMSQKRLRDTAAMTYSQQLSDSNHFVMTLATQLYVPILQIEKRVPVF